MELLQKTSPTERPDVSRAVIRGHVREAWRMRAERRAELLRAAGRSIARLVGIAVAPSARQPAHAAG